MPNIVVVFLFRSDCERAMEVAFLVGVEDISYESEIFYN